MENKRLFGLMCYIHRQISRENNLLLSEYGLSHIQLQTIFFIDKNTKENKKVCQRDIEKQINLRPSSISSMLTHLENNGIITRKALKGDARMKIISLTEKGQSICEKNKQIMDNSDRAIESALNEEEQDTLYKLLRKIIDALQENKEVKN